MDLKKISMILGLFGGINWALVGAFGFNLISLIFGFIPVLASIIQIVIGVAAGYALYMYLK